MTSRTLRAQPKLVAVLLAGLVCTSTLVGTAWAADPVAKAKRKPLTNAELADRLDALAAENAELRSRLDALTAAQSRQTADVQIQQETVQQQTAQLQQQSQQVAAQAQAVADVQASAAGNAGRGLLASWADSTTVSSYGEIGYSHPTRSANQSNVDVARAVIGIQHRFDDRTKMVGEWEWEHAITSSDDTGESEIEQLYVERQFTNAIAGTAGLFLMPVGLINRNHEPTAYYGTFRPDVDTKIVPSTWREVGFGLSGDVAGIAYNVGVTTGPNLSKWEPDSDEGFTRGPLQSIHGEGQFAAARDPLFNVALNYRGIPGLLVGGSVTGGKIGQHQPDFLGNRSRLMFYDVHARYQRGGFEIAGEYEVGTISNTEGLNASYSASSVVNPTLIPARFFGGYVEAAYKQPLGGDYTFAPFIRYEVLNTASNYGSLSLAQGGVKRPDERILTAGASFFIGEGIVLKADYRHYRHDQDPSPIPPAFNRGNSINVGIGYSY